MIKRQEKETNKNTMFGKVCFKYMSLTHLKKKPFIPLNNVKPVVVVKFLSLKLKRVLVVFLISYIYQVQSS